MRHKHINPKEMTAFLHALQDWIPLCKGCHLIIHCDNFAVPRGIANLSMRGQAMHPLGYIVMLTALHDIKMESVGINTKQNAIAYLLSSGHLPQFQMRLCSQVHMVWEAMFFKKGDF